jgi:hypothetical protein
MVIFSGNGKQHGDCAKYFDMMTTADEKLQADI